MNPTPRFLAVGSFLLFCTLVPGSEPPASDPIEQLLKHYASEVAQGVGKDRTPHFVFWEQQFRIALEPGVGGPAYRLRALDELGALQAALDMREAARKTYRRMETEAEKAGNLFAIHTALENQFARSQHDDFEARSKLAERYVGAVERLLMDGVLLTNEAGRNAVLGRYAETLYITGRMYQEEGLARKAAKKADDRATADATADTLLARAENLLQLAFDVGEFGTIASESRLFHLAKTQSGSGKRDKAAESYGKLLAMDQTRFSTVWLGELRIDELFPKDSPEHRAALARLLEDFDRGGTVDEVALQLKLQLGESYRKAKEYEASNGWVNKVVGCFTQPAYNAAALSVLIHNYEDLNQQDLARELQRELIGRYPDTGYAQRAKRQLDQAEKAEKMLREQRSYLESLKKHAATAGTRATGGYGFLILAVNLTVFMVLGGLYVRRRGRHPPP